MNRGAADLLALIGILLILLGWLGGCGRQIPKQYEGRMKDAGSGVYIDTETGICYLARYGGICVMVDHEGKPYIANGWRDYGGNGNG